MTKWLQCSEINRGAFSSERVVTVTDVTGREESLFVPESAVDESNRRLRVSVSQRGDQYWAVLPDEGRTAIAARKEDLT